MAEFVSPFRLRLSLSRPLFPERSEPAFFPMLSVRFRIWVTVWVRRKSVRKQEQYRLQKKFTSLYKEELPGHGGLRLNCCKICNSFRYG